MSASARKLTPRSPRLESRPAEFSSFVRYQPHGVAGSSMAAQFADVSASGMRVISREPARAEVGDAVTVEFTVPGSSLTVKARAFVVRKVNDFIFAVRFVGMKEHEADRLQSAISSLLNRVRWAPLVSFVRRVSHWTMAHRQGILLSLVGALLVGGLGCSIYLMSDEYSGRELQSWAKPYPRQWDWDYYNKLPKPSK